ncbi:hypothetical protein MOO46_04915 [Apilactobacillus apisilvae]|uniref:WxL domain-containing protein n=1 Tax=Apilactobacillus apisilvae TaxID=2923364 RepID=A0ABY4PFM7_9LACO|nr:hypothetical protein [Apilactobacillus apisilvae]UQS84596.1 hypothetical protein MOO46_04915 [Apilactobacillus apisilvae]
MLINSFPIYSSNNNGMNIEGQNNNLKLQLPKEIETSGRYEGTATWNLINGPK